MQLDEIKNKTSKKNLVSLANSIRKYFNLELYHESLPNLDKILEENNPDNVIVMLFDGMGNCFLDRYLDKESFFIQNRIDVISSVYPPTTAAATTSVRSGLEPSESGMTGWWKYVPDIDKVVTAFVGREKELLDEGNINPEYEDLREKLYLDKSISKEIIECGGDSVEFFPFETNGATLYDANNENELYDKVYNYTKRPGKKFIYAYDPEPDHAMHLNGCDSEIVINMIKERNRKVKELCKRLENSIVIVIADHGHVNIDNNIDMLNYKDFNDTLRLPINIEGRTPNFFVKENREKEFVELFNKYFSEHFYLYTKEEIRNSKIFGDNEIEGLWDTFGEYIAIAKDNTTLTDDKVFLISHHGGPSDDEIYVPLIVKTLKK